MTHVCDLLYATRVATENRYPIAVSYLAVFIAA
jgi:hypothetical protein